MVNKIKNAKKKVEKNNLHYGLTHQKGVLKQEAFSLRLKSRRKKLGLLQRELAKKIGVSVTSIQKYESGLIPKGGYLILLSRALFCSIDWLLTGESWDKDQYSVSSDRLSGRTCVKKTDKRSGFSGLCLDEFCPVKMVDDHLSVDNGTVILTKIATNCFLVRKDWISTLATSAENLFLIEVHGDSMEPAIENGDLLIVDQGRKSLKSGCIYAIAVNNTILIRRLDILPSGINVISDNKIYSGFMIEAHRLHVIGRVIWLSKELVTRSC